MFFFKNIPLNIFMNLLNISRIKYVRKKYIYFFHHDFISGNNIST